MASSSGVLFVEDEQYRNDKLVRFLEAHGLKVTPAGTLEEAVAAASQGGHACVLLDVMLPPGNGRNEPMEALTAGVEFLRRLRSGAIPNVDPNLPVVVLTGRVESSIEDDVRALGVSAFFNKPESMETIREEIQKVIGQGT